jgi:UDP:flavonoid glycosyltransferase YjiC (YdhE family)
VRFLFSFVGGRGHVEPLVPIARAAEDAGHTVAFAGGRSIVKAVEALGFAVFPLGPPGDGAPPKRIPLQEVDLEREERDLRERFIRGAARERVPDVVALCADWRPDVLVCEETDFGGVVAAERLGLPYAIVLVLAAGSMVRPEVVAEPLDELRAEHGLPSDPELAMRARYLVLSPFPSRFRDPAFPLPATAHPFRLLTVRPEVDDAPSWPVRLPGAPTVYFTLGTVFNLECGDLFARVLAGLGALPINVVATVGPQIDPEELGPLAENVHVERYLPQASVLPHCSAAVSHGGSGSVLGALAHGLPQVVIPMGADQPANAARCEALGLARVLDAVRATPEKVRDALSAALSDDSYRSEAERFRDEIAALPGPEHAVTFLERLAAERRPVVAA